MSVVSERERLPRRALRLPVKFWRRGQEDEAFAGYAMNVSGGGLFVATHRPLPPNAPVELEIQHPDRAIRTFGRVAHAARFPPEFARVFKSGMGVQFSRPDDPAIVGIASMGQLLADRGGRRQLPRQSPMV